MADDKLKTSPESPGQDRPGEMPAEAAPSMREPPAPETAEPEKVEEHTEPEQPVIPGMDEDAPARPAPGEVVVDFDKINELTLLILATGNLLQIVALLRQMNVHRLRVREVVQVQNDLGLLIHNFIQHPFQLCF